MKKTGLIGLFVLGMLMTTFGQQYKTAIGVKGGYPYYGSLNIKHFFGSSAGEFRSDTALQRVDDLGCSIRIKDTPLDDVDAGRCHFFGSLCHAMRIIRKIANRCANGDAWTGCRQNLANDRRRNCSKRPKRGVLAIENIGLARKRRPCLVSVAHTREECRIAAA